MTQIEHHRDEEERQARREIKVEQEYLHRAKPVDLRKAIETANAMLKAGLMFVVIPVISNADYAVLSEERDRRLEMLIKAVEE